MRLKPKEIIRRLKLNGDKVRQTARDLGISPTPTATQTSTGLTMTTTTTGVGWFPATGFIPRLARRRTSFQISRSSHASPPPVNGQPRNRADKMIIMEIKIRVMKLLVVSLSNYFTAVTSSLHSQVCKDVFLCWGVRDLEKKI